MDSKVDHFLSGLGDIEEVLYSLASRSDELKSFGLSYVLRRIEWGNATPAFENFSTDIDRYTRLAPLVDRKLADRLQALLDSSEIESSLAQIVVRLEIASREQPRLVARGIGVYINALRKFIPSSQYDSLTLGKEIDVQALLAAIARLKANIKSLTTEYTRKVAGDAELFKPSNISDEFVLSNIDAAIKAIAGSSDIRPSDREELVQYLNAAKIEMAGSNPAWRKIVGALVVSATIVGGVAVLPEAAENINKAISHILGSSVSQVIPESMPSLPKLDPTNENGIYEI